MRVISNAGLLLWGMLYFYCIYPVRRWWRRHKHDADYLAHVGWLVGFWLSIILIWWGVTR